MVIVALTLPGKMPGSTFLPTNSTSTLSYLFHHVIRDKRFSHVFHPSADIFSRVFYQWHLVLRLPLVKFYPAFFPTLSVMATRAYLSGFPTLK